MHDTQRAARVQAVGVLPGPRRLPGAQQQLSQPLSGQLTFAAFAAGAVAIRERQLKRKSCCDCVAAAGRGCVAAERCFWARRATVGPRRRVSTACWRTLESIIRALNTTSTVSLHNGVRITVPASTCLRYNRTRSPRDASMVTARRRPRTDVSQRFRSRAPHNPRLTSSFPSSFPSSSSWTSPRPLSVLCPPAASFPPPPVQSAHPPPPS